MSVEAAIVGAGETPYTRRPAPGASTESLLADAARRTLASAGLEPRAVDGLAVASFSLQPDHAVDLAWKLGLRLRWLMDDANGGASGLNMLAHARRAIEAGDAARVLVLGGDLFTPESFRELLTNYNRTTRDELVPLGYGGPNELFAALTLRHMQATGLEESDYAQIPLAQRAWAVGNPGALYREPLSLEQYLAAPVVAEPLRRFDCAPLAAGADGVVLASAGAKAHVRIRSIRAVYNHDGQGGDGLATGLADEADGLYAEAGIGPEDVDVVSVYDDYPVMAAIQLAELGFAPSGDLRRLLHERIATRSLPVNTSGGQLSAGQAGAAGGLHGLVEVVRQLRGEAVGRQVEGARRAVVSGYGMVLRSYGGCANAAVLERVAP